MRNILLVFSLIVNISIIHGARILGAVVAPSFSHQVAFRALWKELSLRGHQLVVLTTDPTNDPTLTNLTEIDLHQSYDIWNREIVPVMNNPRNPKEMIDIMVATMSKILDQQLSHPEVQKLLNNETEHFDLLIAEAAPVVCAFSVKFKCPYIGIISNDAPAMMYSMIGNPVHPIANPDVNLPFFEKLSFSERLISVGYYLFMSYLGTSYMESLAPVGKKHFGEDFISSTQFLGDISLFFVNTNPVLNQIRPLMPHVIQIGGGTHSQPFKPLPKDLQQHVDSATQGFIYFSLGSNVKSKDLPDNTKTVLLETFAELPYKILWKFEFEDLQGKPDNVIISKWFPQQDLFKHPNLKLFITQGGIQSIEEAIYNHIPMLGLPFFMDQPTNVKRMVAKGLGLSLDYKTLDKTTLKETILGIINNPKYRSKAKELADLANDQPMTGLEKAVWWSEYVIRHKGAKHLRSPLLDIPSYQYYLIDVIGFCLGVIIVAVYLMVLFFRLVSKLLKKFVFKSKVKSD